MERHVDGILELQERGAIAFEYGNNIRGEVEAHRDPADPWALTGTPGDERDAFDFPWFVPAYIRPMFCRGQGPFRWLALSGEEADIHRTDAAVKELFPEKDRLTRWIELAQEQVEFQGLPARVCWLGYETNDEG